MSGDEVERLLKGYLDDKKGTPTPDLPAVSKLTDELEGLLGRYLETTDRDADGQPQTPSFALPRKPEIDDALRRFHDNKDESSASVLERSLRDYVETAAGHASSVPCQDELLENAISAEALHKEQSKDERFERYAQMLREAEEAEEELYAFQPDTETIRGMPRASATPTPPKPRRKGGSNGS